MRISARNQFKGKIVGVQHGVTTSHVEIDIGGGVVIMASITKRSAEELQLEVGKDATAIIKAAT
jgi:molybdopterin-binding protein